MIINHLIDEENRIYGEIINDNIVFGQRYVINDFSESFCIAEFRFCKSDLQMLADKLWPFISMQFDGGKTCVKLLYRYTAHYETCLCLYLYRLSFPRRIWNQMETIFGMRRSHISACLVTFGQALLYVSTKFLTDPSIWIDRMPVYAQKIYKKTGLLSVPFVVSATYLESDGNHFRDA